MKVSLHDIQPSKRRPWPWTKPSVRLERHHDSIKSTPCCSGSSGELDLASVPASSHLETDAQIIIRRSSLQTSLQLPLLRRPYWNRRVDHYSPHTANFCSTYPAQTAILKQTPGSLWSSLQTSLQLTQRRWPSWNSRVDHHCPHCKLLSSLPSSDSHIETDTWIITVIWHCPYFYLLNILSILWYSFESNGTCPLCTHTEIFLWVWDRSAKSVVFALGTEIWCNRPVWRGECVLDISTAQLRATHRLRGDLAKGLCHIKPKRCHGVRHTVYSNTYEKTMGEFGLKGNDEQV